MRPLRIVIAILLLACSFGSAFGSEIMAAPGKAEFQHVRWRSKTIKIAISSSLTRPSSNIKADSDVLGAVRRSLKTWSAVADIDLQTEVSDRQSVSQAGPAGDGLSLITIAQTPENVLFFSKDADSASAKTRIFFDRKGFVTEADVVLNPFQQFSTDGTFGTFDLESTLTHEIGHLLGLHHSSVLGATMAESFAKNGTMGFADFSPRTLGESDIAAIRELYGPQLGADNCCGAISGRLSAARQGKILQVWAEDSKSGRVIAQVDCTADGAYRLGGVPNGDYSVYWKTKDNASEASVGIVGNVSLKGGEEILNSKITFHSSGLSVEYLGFNGQLADFGIPLTGGRTYMINLGGKDLNAGSVNIGFDTPSIRMTQVPIAYQEFSEGVAGISFMVTVDQDIPAGQYSIFVNGENGATSCLIGALTVE